MDLKVTSNGGLKRFTRKIQKANLSKTASKLFVKKLKMAINQRVYGAGTGNLSRSVKAVKRGNKKYGVVADYYFWYANYGRSPGKPPGKSVKKIDVWAANVGWTGKGLRKNIMNFGTKPLFFYETAKKMFHADRKRIWKDLKIK